MLRFFRGNDLKRLVDKELKDHKYKLKIVNKISKSLKSDKESVRLIVGDRRRGKTKALLGVIKELDLYEDCVLVTLLKQTDIKEFEKELDEIGEVKYLFIDEVTYFKDLKSSMKYLSDIISPYYAEKIIVSGTWSQVLINFKNDTWFGRVIKFEAKPLSPLDMKKFYGIKSIEEYLKSGGYFPNVFRLSEEPESLTIPLIDLFYQYYNLLKLEKVAKSEIFHDNSQLFLNYLASMYSYNTADISEVNKVINNRMDKIKNIINNMFKYNISDELHPVNKEDLYETWDILIKYDISKSLHNIHQDNSVQIVHSNTLSEYDVRRLLEIGTVPNNRGLQLEHYILRYSDSIKNFIKIQNNGIDFEIDAVDKANKNLIEVKLGNKAKSNWTKHLKNHKVLEKYGLGEYNKIIVYSGDTFNEEGIEYKNIYEFLKEFSYGEILTEWGNKPKENNCEISILWN